MGQTNANFLNGVPELLVLRLLGQREMYGYALVQEIGRATGQSIVLGEGVIYPLLHALERDGALQSRRQAVEGRSRIYYSLTPAGRERLGRVVDDWSRVSNAIARLLARPADA